MKNEMIDETMRKNEILIEVRMTTMLLIFASYADVKSDDMKYEINQQRYNEKREKKTLINDIAKVCET